MAGIDINEAIKNITDDVKTIVRGEVELLKAELVPSGKKAGVGAGMFGAAGYFGLNAVSLLFMAGGFGFGALFEMLWEWPILGAVALGFVCMALILVLIAGIFALIGKAQIKKIKGPDRTVSEANATVDAVKTAVSSGKDKVDTGVSLESYEAERERERVSPVTPHIKN